MKSKKINLSELKVQSFVTSLLENNKLNTNSLKGGSSEDATFSKLDVHGCFTYHLNGCSTNIDP